MAREAGTNDAQATGPRAVLAAPVNGADEVPDLVAAGAALFYFGFAPGRGERDLGAWALDNGRDSPGASVGSNEALADLVHEVHRHGARLMLAMNRSYPAAVRSHIETVTGTAADLGVDGFILGDLGLLRFVVARWPDRTRVASTFLGIHNRAGLQLARELGFDRVVLPRAMRVDEIRELATGDGPGLEVFVARERCRFVNAYCRLEHALPDPDAPGQLRFPASPVCMHAMLDAEGGVHRFEDGAASLDACGLCAIDALRDSPRVTAFKLVGRGVNREARTRFLRAARQVLGGAVSGTDAVRDVVRAAGIRCAPETCHYPVPGPARRIARWPRLPMPPLPAQAPALPRAGAPVQIGVELPPGREPPTAWPGWVAGVRIGHETCEHLLPTPSMLTGWLSRLDGSGLRVTLVLPPLFGTRAPRHGLDLARTLLAHGGTGIEVVANDLGTLVALRRQLGPEAALTLGRNLVAQRLDPRLQPRVAAGDAARTVHPLHWAQLEAAAGLAGVDRLELSGPAAWPDFPGTVLRRATLHVGWALNAVSRACHTLAEIEFETGGVRSFQIPRACARPCLDREHRLHPSGGLEVFRSRGNALSSPTESAQPLPAWVDRVVIEWGGDAGLKPRPTT